MFIGVYGCLCCLLFFVFMYDNLMCCFMGKFKMCDGVGSANVSRVAFGEICFFCVNFSVMCDVLSVFGDVVVCVFV